MSDRPRYRLGDEIGRGALGRVVRVHADDGIERAGKILHASHQADAKARARFEDEAKTLGTLRHPNVVAVHGLEEIDGERVLVMELVDGLSLASAIAIDAPLSEARIIAIGAGMAAGLAEAHHAGLIHRDLKPDNVLLTADDRPKLVDFGMARATSFAGVDPGAFAIVGTPDYMAPETVDPLAVDARSDLYSLGCMLYEMAAGAPPYRGATAFAVLEAHRNAPLPTLPDGAVSPALAGLIASLLAKSPADRPQSAAAVQDALAHMGHSRALVPAADYSLVHGGHCATCGTAAVRGVNVCFGCGLTQVRIEPGDRTVFVIGPGETTDKLDSLLREKLLDWLRSNPSLGLDPKAAAKKVPRLPFVLATRVSARSADMLVASVGELGLDAVAIAGGRFSLPAMRKKSWRMGGRVAAMSTGGLWWIMHTHAILVPAVGLGALATFGIAWYSSSKPVVDRLKKADAALPASIAGPLARIEGAVPGIRERRHRESLRGVVQRVLAARIDGDAGLDDELGRVLDLALVAAVRIDELEYALTQQDARDPTAEARASMIERDAWAARLLELTAFLDVLRASTVAASAATAGTGELDELRAHIEALEEVQAL